MFHLFHSECIFPRCDSHLTCSVSFLVSLEILHLPDVTHGDKIGATWLQGMRWKGEEPLIWPRVANSCCKHIK